jgi:hypothetical protein
MKTIKQQAEEYSMKYPSAIRKEFDIDNDVTLCKECHIQLYKLERGWIKDYEK